MFAGLLIVLPFFTGSFSGSTPFEWRSFADSVTSHHTLIIWSYSALFLWLWVKGVKPLLAVGAIFEVISLHELFWWGFDFFWMAAIAGYHVEWYWLFGYLLPPCLGCALIYPTFVKLPKKVLITVIGFDLIWLAAGWPVTVNYIGGVFASGPLQGLTIWYNTFTGDFWEWCSWAAPLAVMGIAELKDLLKSQELLSRAVANLT